MCAYSLDYHQKASTGQACTVMRGAGILLLKAGAYNSRIVIE